MSGNDGLVTKITTVTATVEDLLFTIEMWSDGVEIAIEGHGHCDGDNSIVHVTMEQGAPMVYVWSDIRQMEPTHIHSLSGAALWRRSKEKEE
jgi:hypothetical protein